jgi:acetoin utilization deacetylase AcuC-like enzyme
MKVIYHEDFKEAYTSDPAAAPGRMESIVEAIRHEVSFEEASPAGYDDIAAIHTASHIESVVRRRLYKIASLAAGAAIQAAEVGMSEPAMAIVRPPGHHASADNSWGFCYFNNMAIALEYLRRAGKINTAYVLDFDMHYGDGTVSILKEKGYVAIHNPESQDRLVYLDEVQKHLSSAKADILAVSAGFDNHLLDWGQVLQTEDYRAMGRMVRETAKRMGAGCFAILEGGYNHLVLGENVLAFLQGLKAA